MPSQLCGHIINFQISSRLNIRKNIHSFKKNLTYVQVNIMTPLLSQSELVLVTQSQDLAISETSLI